VRPRPWRYGGARNTRRARPVYPRRAAGLLLRCARRRAGPERGVLPVAQPVGKDQEAGGWARSHSVSVSMTRASNSPVKPAR
jgi:hypothetical protein